MFMQRTWLGMGMLVAIGVAAVLGTSQNATQAGVIPKPMKATTSTHFHSLPLCPVVGPCSNSYCVVGFGHSDICTQVTVPIGGGQTAQVGYCVHPHQ